MRNFASYSFLLVLSTVSLAGCTSSGSTDKIAREGEPDIYTTSASDAEMTAATAMGKATFPQFLAALARHDSTTSNFAVKVHFDDGSQSEHIWLSQPTIEHGQLYGIVDNTPEFTRQVKEGQKIAVDTSRISDWNYTDGNRLVGGYTIRLLRKRMTPEERTEFDKSTGWELD